MAVPVADLAPPQRELALVRVARGALLSALAQDFVRAVRAYALQAGSIIAEEQR